MSLQGFANVNQRGIAGDMAKTVVDRLQPIDVDEDQGCGQAVTLDIGKRRLQVAHEAAPVGDRHQFIGLDQLLKLRDTATGQRQRALQRLGFLVHGHKGSAYMVGEHGGKHRRDGPCGINGGCCHADARTGTPVGTAGPVKVRVFDSGHAASVIANRIIAQAYDSMLNMDRAVTAR